MDHQAFSRNTRGNPLDLSQMTFGGVGDERTLAEIQQHAARRTQVMLLVLALFVSCSFCMILSQLGY